MFLSSLTINLFLLLLLVRQTSANFRPEPFFGSHPGVKLTKSQPRSSRRSDHFYSSRLTNVNNDENYDGLAFLENNNKDILKVENCRSIGNTLLRGAFLRIASDLSGGTVLESIKTRTTTTREGPFEATRNIVRDGGVLALWKGTPSRTVEGALIGAVFMLGSVATKTQLKKWGAPPTWAALAGGLVGGVAQASIMTPAGLIFTALNSSEDKNENTMGVIRRVLNEKGIAGMYAGGGAMCMRQATNWASRAGFTEIARSVFHLSEYGLIGELASGAIGGVGSCWNTPIETIRVLTQRDVFRGKTPMKFSEYWDTIVEEQGYVGLFRGFNPRAVQAIWQTVFLVVVPNLMGI